MTELEELESIYCDMHKDVHGVKARWARFVTVAEARAALDALQAEGQRVWADEREAQQRAIHVLEGRITEYLKMGCPSRDDAIRWIDDAEGAGGDQEYLCHLLGVPYGYFNR